jgi:hypothetical protein
MKLLIGLTDHLNKINGKVDDGRIYFNGKKWEVRKIKVDEAYAGAIAAAELSADISSTGVLF